MSNQIPKIILASQSRIRKIMMDEAQIPYEVIVSHADETPLEGIAFEIQLEEISMRKAKTVFEMTKDRGKRIIVAADQNIVFENTVYGKPKTIEDARALINSMFGSDQVYAYTGNAILYADGYNILNVINKTDIARMHMLHFTQDDLETYLRVGNPLIKCGGISIHDTPFLRLLEGKMSTAMGMTIEYLYDMLEII